MKHETLNALIINFLASILTDVLKKSCTSISVNANGDVSFGAMVLKKRNVN